MNRLIVYKNHRERIIISCPLYFWATLTDNLSWLFVSCLLRCFPYLKFQGRFGNPVFAPQSMSLLEMAGLILQQLPVVGARKVHLPVTICIKHHFIHVDVMVARWIDDSDILYALVYHQLRGSSELEKLPRWMRRDICRRARRAKLVSTKLSYENVCSRRATDIISKGAVIRTERLIFSAEIVSVTRCLDWKGCSKYARDITDLGTMPEIVKNIGLLSSVHPMCYDLAVKAYSHSHWLSRPLICMLATFGKRYPCFFYSKAGSRMLAVIYIGVGVLSILRAISMELSALAQQACCFWRGDMVSISIEQARPEGRIDCLQGLFPDNLQTVQASLPKGTLRSGYSAPDLTELIGEADNNENTRSSTAPTEADPSLDSALESSEKESSVSKATMEDHTPTLEKTLAAAYVRATGAKNAPHIVVNAADLDNVKKSSKFRRINRYSGNIPALSIEAMMEVFDVMYPGYYITDFVRAKSKGEKDIIYLHTNSREITCPCCGEVVEKAKDANTRTLQDVSLRNGVGVQIELTAGRFACENPECTEKNICRNEPCSFAHPYKKYTTRVEYLALAIGISSSFHDTERQMKLLGIQYGDDCVRNLLASLKFSDEKDVIIIGIDDVSVCKGQRYCTIIYNLENGHMLKLIEGRTGKEFERKLESWLDEHPKITTICRDRAAAYGCYIDRYCRKRNRKIMQVADRFHLLQNLSDHLRDTLYQSIPYRIALSVGKDGVVILDKMPQMVAIPVSAKPEGLADWHYDNNAPVDSMGKPICIEICVDRVSEKMKAARIESRVNMFERFEKAREDYAALQGGFAWGEKKKFADEHGISVYQLQKYVMEMEQQNFDREYGKAKGWNPASRPKLFDGYKNLAYKMLKDGHDIMDVYWYIKDKVGGWSLADSTLVDYIMETYKLACPDEPLPLKEELIRMDYPDNEMVIGRQKLFYALMTLDEKKLDQSLAPHLDLICKTYPVCETIRSTFKEFHDIIIVDKEMDKRTPEKCEKALKDLDAFIKKHQNDNLKGFANSLQSDIKCVSNAITTLYNSGGVEGRNCKYKAVLRSSYGHIPVETLEQKLKAGFMYTGTDFSLSEIAPWLVYGLPA